MYKSFVFFAFTVVLVLLAEIPSAAPAQEWSIFQQTKQMVAANQYEAAIKLNEQYIKKAEVEKKAVDQAIGYLNIGSVYTLLSNYKETVRYLDKANAIQQNIPEPELAARLHIEYANVLLRLNMDSVPLNHCDEAILACQKITDRMIAPELMSNAYTIKAHIYGTIRNADAMYKSLKQALQFKVNPLGAAMMAKYFLKFKENADSSASYLLKAEEAYARDHYPSYYKGVIWRYWGELYVFEKKYTEAIRFYNSALLNFQETRNVSQLATIYDLLYIAHKNAGNKDSSTFFMEKRKIISDSLDEVYKVPLNVSISHLQNESSRNLKNARSYFYWIIGIVILLAGGGWLFYYQISIKKKTEREKKLNVKTAQVEVLQQQVSSATREVATLQNKITITFDTLVQMAINGDPAFYENFLAAYPHFQKKLLAVCPGLLQSELTLAAQLYLGFSSKQIAAYTYKSVRTVDNRRYSLRRKLSISTQEDIRIWLKNMIIGD